MADNKKFTINVMMFGGRRSGKTSVLAVMKDSADKKFSDNTNMGVYINSADDNTGLILEKKMRELHEYYNQDDKTKFTKGFTPDDSPTPDKTEYMFDVSLIDKPKSKIQVNFTDYPGEWLDDSEHYKILSDVMSKSDVILIAVDTPYLMEEPQNAGDVSSVGRFNDNKNFSEKIAEMVKKSFVVDEDSLRKKMILFVPLKCEGYYNEINHDLDKMDEVRKKIKKAYEKVISHITQGENANRYECAIAPIFTMGNLRFKGFKREEDNNNLVMDSNMKIPVSIYKFDDGAGDLESKYCEQPLLYTLVFLLKWAEQTKSKKGKLSSLFNIFDNLASRFLKYPAAADFAEKSEFLRSQLKKGGDGYEIISDPLNFK